MCASARRAVYILKHELQSMKVSIGKLFPKNGTIQQQLETLYNHHNTTYPIVIGTPHRIYQLSKGCSSTSTSNSTTTTDSEQPSQQQQQASNQHNHHITNNKVLHWDEVRLLIFDNELQKQYTVITLPDTFPYCMKLLMEYMIPQLLHIRPNKNKNKLLL